MRVLDAAGDGGAEGRQLHEMMHKVRQTLEAHVSNLNEQAAQVQAQYLHIREAEAAARAQRQGRRRRRRARPGSASRATRCRVGSEALGDVSKRAVVAADEHQPADPRRAPLHLGRAADPPRRDPRGRHRPDRLPARRRCRRPRAVRRHPGGRRLSPPRGGRGELGRVQKPMGSHRGVAAVVQGRGRRWLAEAREARTIQCG